MVPATGAIEFVMNSVIAAINETGYRRTILKREGEPAILALKQDVKLKAKDIEIVLKVAPTGDHSADGLVEGAIYRRREATGEPRKDRRQPLIMS